MIKDGNVVHVTVKNYKFDGKFPHKKAQPTDNTIIYSDNVGSFSTFGLQIFIEDNAETNKASSNYWLDAKVDNMNATTISNDKINTQMVTSDDENRASFVMYLPGKVLYCNGFYNLGVIINDFNSSWNRGDGAYV